MAREGLLLQLKSSQTNIFTLRYNSRPYNNGVPCLFFVGRIRPMPKHITREHKEIQTIGIQYKPAHLGLKLSTIDYIGNHYHHWLSTPIIKKK